MIADGCNRVPEHFNSDRTDEDGRTTKDKTRGGLAINLTARTPRTGRGYNETL